MNLNLNIYFELCKFLDIYIWTIFVFAWIHSTILLTEYEFMTRGIWNFMEKSETWKTIRKHWACYWLVLVHVLFPTTIWFYFLLVSVNIYLFILYRIEYPTNQKSCLNKKNNSVKGFNKIIIQKILFLIKISFLNKNSKKCF